LDPEKPILVWLRWKLAINSIYTSNCTRFYTTRIEFVGATWSPEQDTRARWSMSKSWIVDTWRQSLCDCDSCLDM